MTPSEKKRYFMDILENVRTDEILAQLMEECSELAIAASKLRRGIVDANPTPVTVEQATKMIYEELADVLLCARLIGFYPYSEKIIDIQEQKLRRWAERIEASKKGDNK